MTATAWELSQKAGQAPQESGQALQEGLVARSLWIIKDHTAVAILWLLVAVGGWNKAMAQTDLPPWLEYTVANPEKVPDGEEIVIAVNNTPQPISQSVWNQVIEDLKTPLLTPEEMGKISDVKISRQWNEIYEDSLNTYNTLDPSRQLLISDAIWDNGIFSQLSPDEQNLVKDLRLPESAMERIIAEAKTNGANIIQIKWFRSVLIWLRENGWLEDTKLVASIAQKSPLARELPIFVRYREIAEENEAARAENEAARAENEAARAENEAARAENEAATARYEAARAENEAARAENEAARAENEKIRAFNEAAEKAIESWKEALKLLSE